MIKEHEALDKIKDTSDSLNLIGTELTWMLTECKEKQIEPNSAIGREMQLKFYQLYQDFKKIKQQIKELSEDMTDTEFEDMTLEIVCQTACNMLLRKCEHGLYAQFSSVAEHGILPE